jgi:hypothetical protein
MKIPITLTYKYFDETISVKKKVDDMHIGETLDMYKSIMVPIFGEKSYEDSIISLSDRIKSKRNSNLFQRLFRIFKQKS